MGTQAFIFLTIALAISEFLNIFNLIYQRNPKSRNKPIKGYLQLVKLIIYVVCVLMIIGTFLDKDVFTLLAGFGAMAAVLMLVFQNTILSLVASVQISSYDMVRIGDWIEMPSLNADGDVIDISLHKCLAICSDHECLAFYYHYAVIVLGVNQGTTFRCLKSTGPTKC